MQPSFATLGVPAELTTRLVARGIDTPFPIQAATLPDALAGRDLCGRAPTGSGKTLAFGLALAARLPRAESRRPTGLVLVPTRELAAQVCRELAWIGAGDLRTLAVYGGVGYEPQTRALARGVDLVVACPGRLEDLLASGALRLDAVSTVVLDEADRMADMGFVPAVRRILDATPAARQTLLFSATLDGEVDHLVRRYLSDPARHDVAGVEAEGDVEHHFWRVDRADRMGVLRRVLAGQGRSVVFCRTRHGADRVARQLTAAGIESVALHGDRTQGQRDRAIAAFAQGRARALVATDVAARGIHVEDVTCVVHFDPPADHKDYTHRSGRTGRAGATGTVVTFVWNEVRKDVTVLQRKLSLPQRVDDVPDLPTAPAVPVRVVAPEPAPRPVHDDRRPARKKVSARHQAAAGGRGGDRPNRKGRGPQPHEPKQRVGVVKFFDARKGYGFIARDGEQDVFVHSTAVAGSGLRRLEQGQRVAFDLEPGPNGQQAGTIRIL